MIKKVDSAEWFKLPQTVINYSNNLVYKHITLLEYLLIESDFSSFKDCFDVFGDVCPICNRRVHNAS